MCQTKCSVSLCRSLQLRPSLSARRRDCARVTSNPEVEPRRARRGPEVGIWEISRGQSTSSYQYFERSVEVVRSNLHFADLQRANDNRLHRDYILLVLEFALYQ